MKTQTTPYDCIVIGAGAAGLACARKLLDAGKNVIILEARNRIGGRAFTVREPTLDYPIELGAEFIHGNPKAIIERLETAGLTSYSIQDEHLWRNGKNLESVDFFEDLENLLKKLDDKRAKDRSVKDFLDAQRNLPQKLRDEAKSYVEGFHAADLNLIGEKYLALAESGGDEADHSQTARITQGYGDFMLSFLHGIEAKENRVQLNTIVKKIEWKKNKVRLKVRSRAGFDLPDLRAKKVVITVPLGVLKAPAGAAAAVEFDPPIEGFDKMLSGLEMGHCLRAVFRFRSRDLWEKKAKSEEPVVFLHAHADKAFPTWWTTMPMRTPYLTAWQGGPKAQDLANLNESDRVRAALETLAYILDEKLTLVQEQLVSWHMHDWSSDPFSYGAYSYVGVDGEKRAKKLTEPFSDTLYFAGEATHMKAERGTLDGALATGLRAAEQILGQE